MHGRLAFDVDCTSVIPECGFECSKCVEEIQSALSDMQGVGRVYIEKEGEEQTLIVEHDAMVVTMEQLTGALEGLPSFYEGFFRASVVAG